MPTLKVVLLGDSSVGKSSLVHRFSSGSFDPHSANTIGAAFISKEHESGQRKVKFEIWDTAGQERYKSLTPMYYRSAKVALVCFDLANAKQSFERAKYWADQLHLSGPADIDVRIVGTKMDLVNGSGNTESLESTEDVENTQNTEITQNAEALTEIAEYCRDNNLPFVRTSARLDQGVNEIFSSIVDSLDEDCFRESNEDRREESDNVLLRIHANRSGCC